MNLQKNSKLLILAVSLLILISCSPEKKLTFNYNLEERSLEVSSGESDKVLEIQKAYQYAVSENRQYIIYSKPEEYFAPDVYLYNIKTGHEKRLTENISDIEYDLAVDDNASCAFVNYNWEFKISQIFLNGNLIESFPHDLEYKELHFFDGKLFLIGEALTTGKSSLFVYDIESKTKKEFPLSIAVYQMNRSLNESPEIILGGGYNI